MVVRSPRVWTALLRGSRGLGESYADALWDSPDLTADDVRTATCPGPGDPFQLPEHDGHDGHGLAPDRPTGRA